MRFKEITESTTAGSVAPVAHAFVKMKSRNPSVYGDQKVGNLLTGKKTNKPFANSINEGAVKQLSMDLKELKDEEFKKKYKITKQEARKNLSAKPEPIKEAELSEDDIILVPGQGRIRKSGFVKNDPDKAEREGETIKNSLHTIARIAKELDRELSLRDNFPEWASEKIGTIKGMITSVADYVISSKEMQHDPDAMEGMAEGKIDFAKKLQKNVDKHNKAVVKTKKDIGSRVADIGPGGKEYNVKTDAAWDAAKDKVREGAKVDRMVKHVAQSEKKLGHSKKEAENIAWATANKRGMLDNKNKKAK